MKIEKFLAKRWWISAIGYALAGGFINNLVIAPFTGQPLVEWAHMLTALGILLGISGARDYLTRNKAGWALFGGFFINCVLGPYLKIQPNDWAQLIATLTVMLGISGARDVGLMPKIDEAVKAKAKKADSEQESKD